MQYQTIDDLLAESLHSIYSAERQLADYWPKFADAASAGDLKDAFRQFHEETLQQVSSLEEVFDFLDIEPQSRTGEAMAGILHEAANVIGSDGSTDVKDAALICAARIAKHYEIAVYECMRTYARQAGHLDLAMRFQEALDEEHDTDQQLLQLMERSINVQVSGG